MSIKKRGLGRNLEALLGDLAQAKPKNNAASAVLDGELRQIPLAKIMPGKYQPRLDFSPEALEELANSIRAQGIIQPIVVRTLTHDQYEIIAGERRFRAAELAGLTTIPAIVRELPDEAVVAVALIENIQRENLNPIEEAKALTRLIGEFALTHEQVANAVGKSRASISNTLRLLTLSPNLQQRLQKHKLEMGHARALLSLSQDQQEKIADLIALRSLSVRQTEDMVRKLSADSNAEKAQTNTTTKDSYLHELEQKLAHRLHAPVLIQQNAKSKGKIVIKYKNAKQLENVYLALLGEE